MPSIESTGADLTFEPLHTGDPTRVSGKRIVERLGEHATGVAYLAWDPQLERKVLVELLRPSLVSQTGFTERLREQVELLSSVRHPYISPLYELRPNDNPPHLVAEWAEGRTLEQLMARAGLKQPDKLRLFVRVLRALAHAHRKQLLHLGLEPRCIVVDEDQHPHLARYGLAVASRTLDGTAMRYQSPELARGEPNVDARSDLYSAGVILYELLSGRLPYEQRDRTALRAEIAAASPVSMRPLRGLSRHLREVLAQALAKSPDDRYPSADRWADELEPYLEAEREAAAPERRWPELARMTACGGLVMGTLLGMSWLVVDEVRQGRVEPAPIATPPAPTAREDLADLFQRARVELDDGRVESALAALVARGAEPDPEGEFARRLRAFLTFPKPLTDFALVSPRQTSQLVQLAWRDDAERLSGLAKRLVETGEPLLALASTDGKLEGQRILETAQLLGSTGDGLLHALASSYLSTGQLEAAHDTAQRLLGEAEHPGPGLLLRARVRFALERRAAGSGPIPLERLESVVADLEQALSQTATPLDADGALSAAQLLWPIYHRSATPERATQLIGRMVGRNPFDAFASWATAQALAAATPDEETVPVARAAYHWRFEGVRVEADGPVRGAGLFLLPQSLRFDTRDPHCLVFGAPGSWIEVAFRRPAASARVMLQLRGQGPTQAAPGAQNAMTLRVGDTTLVAEQRLFDGLPRVLDWDVSDIVRRAGDEPITARLELSPQATMRCWLLEIAVVGRGP